MTFAMNQVWMSQETDSAERARAAIAAGDILEALVAVEGAPKDIERETRAHLHAWSASCERRLAMGARPHEALHATLVTEAELRGAPEVWRDPAGLALSRVVAHRRGQPMALSAVWLAVAQGAGIAADGIALPGYFVVRVHDGARHVLVDPFERGVRINIRRCKALVAEASGGAMPWCRSYLQPASVAQIVARWLRGMYRIVDLRGDDVARYRVASLAAALDGHPESQLLVAALAERMGASRHAGDLYRAIAASADGAVAMAAERRSLCCGEPGCLH